MNKPGSGLRELRPDGLLERDRTVPYPISSPNRNRTVSETVTVSVDPLQWVKRAVVVRKDEQLRAERAKTQELQKQVAEIPRLHEVIGKLTARVALVEAERDQLKELGDANLDGLNAGSEEK